MSEQIEELPLRYGKDAHLEELADRLLAAGAGENRRSAARDIEKMRFESRLLPIVLTVYDPEHDWQSHDEPWTIPVSDIALFTPSECSGGDGNTRALSKEDPSTPDGQWGRGGAEELRRARRHVDDEDSWGSTFEYIPPIGPDRSIERKVCSKCNRLKRLQHFYAQPRNRDGYSSWCKACQKKSIKHSRNGNAQDMVQDL